MKNENYYRKVINSSLLSIIVIFFHVKITGQVNLKRALIAHYTFDGHAKNESDNWLPGSDGII